MSQLDILSWIGVGFLGTVAAGLAALFVYGVIRSVWKKEDD
jgi:hypothetical protein